MIDKREKREKREEREEIEDREESLARFGAESSYYRGRKTHTD